MKTPTLLCLLIAAARLDAAPIQHDFLAIDEGLNGLMHVNEANPKVNWLVKVGRMHPRDMQLEGGDLLLISHDQGYCEYNITTGERVKDVSIYHDVSSARRLPNGDLLLAGVDFDQPKKNKGDGPVGDPLGKHVVFAEFAPDGHVVQRTTYVGDYLRLVRETAAGTYLCGCNTMFKEADGAGNWIREIKVAGFQHAWMALRLPNGDTLMSSGYGTSKPQARVLSAIPDGGTAFMAEVDASGNLVRRFGAADQVPAGVHPYFYGMFQVMANGDVVVANWQGHGPGHGGAGAQILEFDPQGAIVWQWSDRYFISSLQNVLILDGLDRSVMNDELGGVMGPVEMPVAAAPAQAH
jgi:hypothetical protein